MAISICPDDVKCVVTGGKGLGSPTPVMVLNVVKDSPYFGIIDLGIVHDLKFNGTGCGNITYIENLCSAGK
jgi:hypothetical protein